MKNSNQQLFSSPWTILYLPKYSPVALAWNSNVLKEGALFMREGPNAQKFSTNQCSSNCHELTNFFALFPSISWKMNSYWLTKLPRISVLRWVIQKLSSLSFLLQSVFRFLIFANWLNWQHLNFNYSSWHNFCRAILTVLSI